MIYIPHRHFYNEACSFIDAAALTVENQRIAINELTKQLINSGLWTKAFAIYPIIGGNEAKHSVNLKTPGTYDLTFPNGAASITHASTGMAGIVANNGYWNSLIPGNTFANNDISAFVNIRTQVTGINGTADLVTGTSTTNALSINSNNTDTPNHFVTRCYNTTADSSVNNTAAGFFGLTKLASDGNYYRKFINKNKTTVSQTASAPSSGNIQGMRFNTVYNNREQNFIWIGYGLTDAELESLYDIMQIYQTALGRQI